MQVDPEDVPDELVDGVGAGQAAPLGSGEEATDRPEEEGSRATGRVEDCLDQRLSNGVTDHALGQPVGRVVLAEAVPRLGIDHRLVEDLEHVVLDLGPLEPGEAPRQSPHQPVAIRGRGRPVEEVGLDDTTDLRLPKRFGGEEAPAGVRGVGEIDP